MALPEQQRSPFTGKVAFVTGSTNGIGWATARALAKAGAVVVLNGRNAELLTERARTLTEFAGPNAAEPLALAFDAADLAATRDAYKAIFGKYKRLDILVNNAGILRNGLIGMLTDDHIRETFAVNTVAVIHHIQEASRIMMRNKSGAIVNLASVVGRTGSEGQIVYSASKAALVGVTLSAAKELAGRGIRVNAVAPGMIRTDLLNDLPQAKLDERVASIRMGRLGEPEEVAEAILFLCSPQASYITGQILGIDGGIVL